MKPYNFFLHQKRDFCHIFFKTGKGQYAEGDQFIGVVVPDSRKLVKEYWQKSLLLDDVQEILKSEFHEMRLVALLILVTKFEKTKDEKEKKHSLILSKKYKIYQQLGFGRFVLL